MTRWAGHLRSPALPWIPTALLIAVVVEIGLRVVRLPRLAAVLGVPLSTGPMSRPAGGAGDRSRLEVDLPRFRAARAVMRRWPIGREARCLRTSLLIGYLIRHRGPELRIGATTTGGQVRAHAWLVVDGVDLDPAAADYSLFRSV